jgi:hypothetical protein
MTAVQRVIAKAGSAMGLSFFLSAALLFLQCDVSSLAEEVVVTFQEFESSCINLGQYDAKTMELTVRFVGKKPEQFYRYSNVSAEIWKDLNALNDKGGVGGFLNETVVQHPERYPFKELTIRSFKTISKKKKAGDSK